MYMIIIINIIIIITISLTSNHATSTVSYCTPKSQCSVWHCKCDKQVRANIAPVPLIGVIFSLANEDFSYFLPLAYSKDGTNDDNCFTIPLPSDTTITQRLIDFFIIIIMIINTIILIIKMGNI